MAKFKQEVLNRMKADPDLFAALCKAMDVKPSSMTNTIDRNSGTLNQYNIVALVADHLGKNPEDLLEEESEEKEPVKVSH